jgi:antitoxin component YwqK of YwqJK toxin-antitoxin module
MVYSSGRKVDVWKMYDENGRLTNEMAMETEE